jgi:DNA-binding transcriptional ArsR family regulator
VIPYQEQFVALADGTRRAILARLIDGPLSVGELANDFPMSRPAISQHLRVLKDANLVIDSASGNRRLYAINMTGINSIREYFDQFWDQALAAFKRKAEEKRETK